MTATATNNRICEQTFQVGRALTVTEVADGDLIEIKPVRVVNPVSKNGGEYRGKALDSIAERCDRCRVSIEHTDESGRKYADRHGQLREGRRVHDGVEATLLINKGAPLAEKIRIDARHFPENICLSIELPPDGWIGEDNRHKGGGYIVEDVVAMDDVAIVSDGGTTKSLTESDHTKREEEETMANQQTGTADVAATIQTAITESEQRRKIDEQINSLTRKVDDQKAVIEQLTKERDELKAEKERTARISRIITEAKEVGAGEISEAYALTLTHMPQEAVTEQLKERAELLKKAGGQQQGGVNNGGGSTGQNFNAPSVGNENSNEEDKQFAWL